MLNRITTSSLRAWYDKGLTVGSDRESAGGFQILRTMASLTERHTARCDDWDGGGGCGWEGTADTVGASRVETAVSSNDETRIVG